MQEMSYKNKITLLSITGNKKWTVDQYNFEYEKHIEVINLIIKAKRENSKELDLSKKDLKFLPIEIGELSNLVSLDLRFNELTILPSEIGNLTNLKSLDLRVNSFISLSKEIGKLVSLTSLGLSVNHLTELPPEIGQLRKLISLHLSDNELTSLPIELGQLLCLESLNLSYNKLDTILEEIGQLTELKLLDLRGNLLTVLPAEIGKLSKLEKLNISNRNLLGTIISDQNNVSRIPPEIQHLKSLKELDLRDNNIPIPPEILEQTQEPQIILNYYFSHRKRSHNECKVMIVGQGGVGKTSLVTQFTLGQYNLNEPKTEGILINHWKVKNKSKTEGYQSKITLNLWDFGGQEIMHATHQFFLTKRSLYLLVLDSRLTQEENRIEYWLKIIQSFGGESPVLIIGNKIDQHPLDIDRTGLQKKYPNIVGILETSAATGAGIEVLKQAITKQVNNLPHVRDSLPETWFTIKTKLEELGQEKNYISRDKYIELCAENGVSDEASQCTLIGFLHDLGVVLHFQDDPRLEALGILNPQWVTNGVYKILNSHALFQNKGVLTLAMLNEILNIEGYPRDKRLFIVDMMKKFELCYDIEPDKIFLVPDLLPKDEPTTDGRDNALAFQYHYAILPSSVITRFIVRMNEFIHERVWRSGVVLKDGCNTAVIKADTEDRKVFVWVSGDEYKRLDFLSKIRGQFDAIHKTISKLEVKEMVPVPGHPEAEPVDYDLLLQMDHNNVEVYPVLSGGRMIVVKVREMLSGVARQEDRQRGNITNIYIRGDVKDSTIISGDENEVNK